MQLSSLGWNEELQRGLEQLRSQHQLPELSPARVIVEHRGAYRLLDASGVTAFAELTGKLRHAAIDKRDLPAVGDWVGVGPEGRIEALLPRATVFVRKAAGQRSEPQVIAANIGTVLIVTSANADFNPRRIERYVAAVRQGGAAPVLVVNKSDLLDDRTSLIDSLGPAAQGLPIVQLSALRQTGLEQLAPYIGPGKTVALVGSSGVGKTTLVSCLLGGPALATAPIREHDAHGRHTTSHRELFVMPSGGALIDTPGMRELALWSEDGSTEGSFAEIEQLAQGCRFVDCRHQAEPGCAIQAALAAGSLDPARFAQYEKLERELAFQRDRGTPAARREQARLGRARAAQLKRGPAGKR